MRVTNRAEIWERAYDAFQQVNFAAWDYNTIKESLLDYIKLYRPEDFSDFIESSELIMVLELFAYVGELMAYRSDLNANENFISTAKRKESVLRLAKYLSYNASRNLPARGLVKLTSIVTTERVFDSRGNDLANQVIYWNDLNNPNWKEQFVLVINKVLEQEFGTVSPSDRVQVRDVLFESYTLKNNPFATETIPFTISVSNNSYPMEVVATKLDPNSGPYERRPEKNQKMTVLYLSDGLGDASDNTGFFYFVKQGSLGKLSSVFDGITPNQTFNISVNNCNDTDIWVNNVDPVSGQIIEGQTDGDLRVGEWERVDVANSQNVLFNTNPNRNKFEVETLANDQARILFGDGRFASIPSGTFDFWYRVSANEDLVIPTTSIQNFGISIPYLNSNNKEETLTTSFSLTTPIQNAAPSEDIEHIRRIAPAVYYTQDRMVNGRDYNEFMLQDNSILKLRAINRTFAGDSKYIQWHDPRESYENVKIFGQDLVIYYKNFDYIISAPSSLLPEADGGLNSDLVNAVINNYIQPIFQQEPYFIKCLLQGIAPRNIRKFFNTPERELLFGLLSTAVNNTPSTVYGTLSNVNQWTFFSSEPSSWDMSVEVQAEGNWAILYKGIRMVVNSPDTKFWISNDNNNVITYDTLNSNYDNIVILKANIGADGLPLTQNRQFRILRQELVDVGEFIGTESIHELHVIPEDENNDGIPDEVSLSYLINPEEDFVYFSREDSNSEWVYRPASDSVISAYEQDQIESNGLWKREIGRDGLNFVWLHRTPRYHLIDPAPSNIIDTYVIPRGYYFSLRSWLNGRTQVKPTPPTPFQLRNDYAYLLENKMISDTVILHPGKIKIVIGSLAQTELQATIKVVRAQNRTLTNNQIKVAIVDAVNEFFDINRWEFGETFYFSELSAYIHSILPTEIDSIVLVPNSNNQVFGDLQQIFAKDDEIIQPSITVDNIEIVQSLNPRTLKQAV